jgi:hypothetical protein
MNTAVELHQLLNGLTPSEQAAEEAKNGPQLATLAALPAARDSAITLILPGGLLRVYGKAQLKLRLDTLIKRLTLVAKIES